jgi:hypothetical protein
LVTDFVTPANETTDIQKRQDYPGVQRMRALRLLAGVAFAIGAISATIWSARYSPWVKQEHPTDSRIVRRVRAAKDVADLNARVVPETFDPALTGPIETPPPLATKAPFPRVDSGRTVYDFGTLLVNTEGRHTFRIENKGEGPLSVAKGPVECSCVVSKLSAHEVPPGGFAEVELRWRPAAADSEFHKSAIFWTNDPQRPLVRFSVDGRVSPVAVIAPGKWNAGIVTEDREGKAMGTITSEVDGRFKIVSVQPTDPNVRVVFKPIAKDALQRSGIRGGYEFTATVGKGIRLGPWRSLLRIVTTLEDSKTIEVELTALRSGPISFLPAVPIVGTAHWDSEKLLLNLERFSRVRGSKAAVPALIGSMKDEFRILNVSSSSYPFIKVAVERDPAIASGGLQGVRFVFEVPSGAPAVTHMVRDPVHVTVTTNHPTLHQIDFAVAFVSG